jgi:hypothetical protein
MSEEKKWGRENDGNLQPEREIHHFTDIMQTFCRHHLLVVVVPLYCYTRVYGLRAYHATAIAAAAACLRRQP